MEVAEAGRWIREQVVVDGAPAVGHEQPWSTVMRVPLRGGSSAWFKACALVQAFEPGLTSSLCRRWPDVMPDLIAEDAKRGWLLVCDAGTRLIELDNHRRSGWSCSRGTPNSSEARPNGRQVTLRQACPA
jgi:hypothetical protein